jgi:hypothetical protein
VLEALEQTAWNLSQAAARLEMPRNTLRYRMERLGLRPPPPSRRHLFSAAVPDRPSPRAGHRVATASRAPRDPAEGERGPNDRSPLPAGSESADAAGSPLPAGSPEHRRLSWLRADLVGESPGASEFDTSRALEIIAEKIHSFGGEIELLHRTRVVAVFGLEPVEDAPRRTALTALAVQKTAERARRDGAWPWSVKLGIHVHDCALKAAGTARPSRSTARRRPRPCWRRCWTRPHRTRR